MKSDFEQSAITAPTIHKAPPRKRRIAFNETEQAAQAIGTLEHGCEIFGLTQSRKEIDRIGSRKAQGALPFEFKPLPTWRT